MGAAVREVKLVRLSATMYEQERRIMLDVG